MNTKDCTHDCSSCGASCGIGPLPPGLFPQNEYVARMKALLKMRRALKLDAIMLFDELNNHYFTGLSCDSGFLSVTAEGPVFHTDPRYSVAAKRIAPWLETESLKKRSEESTSIARLCRSAKRIGIESNLPAGKFLKLKELLSGVEFIFVDAEISRLRSIKSKAEINAIRKSAAINDAVFQTWLNNAPQEASEWEIRTELRGLMDFAAQGEAFDTIVCAGRNAAECHHVPDDTIFSRGKTLLIDMGVKCDYYCSDMTRMVFWGEPKKEMRSLMKLVSSANRAAIAAIRPGVPCEAIDNIARSVLANAGFEKEFCHSLGHSFGLFIHESPCFARGDKTLLQPGMVLTVEPGIYLPGRLGIRLEDDILVTKTGCEVLTSTPHDLPAL